MGQGGCANSVCMMGTYAGREKQHKWEDEGRVVAKNHISARGQQSSLFGALGFGTVLPPPPFTNLMKVPSNL